MSSPRLGIMAATAIGDATKIIPDLSALKGPAPPCKRPRSKGALSCIFQRRRMTARVGRSQLGCHEPMLDCLAMWVGSEAMRGPQLSWCCDPRGKTGPWSRWRMTLCLWLHLDRFLRGPGDISVPGAQVFYDRIVDYGVPADVAVGGTIDRQ